MIKHTSLLTIPVILGGLGGLPALASAQSAGPVPVGATTDRISTEPFAFSADVALTLYEEPSETLDVFGFGLRLDLHGQYLADIDAGLVGGYLTIPIGYLDAGDDAEFLLGDSGDESALGNIELGAAFVPASLPVLFRLGLTLQTADDEFAGVTTNALTSAGRITDLVLSAPESTWLRLGASPMYRAGVFVARADLGLDIPVATEEGVDEDVILRLNLAAGADVGPAVLLAELATVGTTGDVADDEDRFLHTLALTGRGTGPVAPFGSLIVQLEEERRDLFALVVLVGVRMAPAMADL